MEAYMAEVKVKVAAQDEEAPAEAPEAEPVEAPEEAPVPAEAPEAEEAPEGVAAADLEWYNKAHGYNQ